MTAAALYGLYLVLAVLAGGIYLALPSEGPLGTRLFWSGLVAAAAGLAAVAVYLAWWLGAGYEGRVFFVIFAVLAVAGAIRVVTHVRPVYSAVYLVLVVLAVTGLCVLAAAEFLAAALVIVYGGAILVTYIFVIMLAQQAGEVEYDERAREPLAAVVMGFALMAATTQAMVARDPIALHAMEGRRPAGQVTMVRNLPVSPSIAGGAAATANAGTASQPSAAGPGNVRQVGAVLMRDYMLAVQVAGILMLVAMVGAIAIARKRIDPEDMTAHERAQAAQAEQEPVGRFVEPYAKVGPRESR